MADTWHTVRSGQTLSHIARRYGVSQRQIAEANRMRRNTVLRVGMRLRIPDGSPSATPEEQGRRVRGSIQFLRLNNGEEARMQLVRRDGRINPSAWRRFRQLLRHLPTNQRHRMHPRLLRLVQKVGDRWPSRKIVVISGYRPSSENRGHSRHTEGRAIDFRVQGVSNSVLRDYCREFNRTGVGYYPNSVFVHLDVRRRGAYWVDWSRPGEPPRYRRPPTAESEGGEAEPVGDEAAVERDHEEPEDTPDAEAPAE